MTTANIEEYLETFYALEEENKPATTTEIAKRLGFAAPSVTEMLKRLDDEGYVRYEPYKGVTLTDKGRQAAKKIKRKHRVLERFLRDILKMPEESVHEEACEMEHAVSDEVESGLCKILGYPEVCPDGKPIPICDIDVRDCTACEPTEAKTASRQESLRSLCSLRPGEKAVVRFIRGGRMAVKRLNDLGVNTGTQIQLKNCAPLGGPVEIIVRGSNLAIGHGLATKIFVEVC
jgi:DtxR family Mn-dependent transcriptional regulator